MGNKTTIMRLIAIVVVLSALSAQQQRVIRRIQGNPINIFYVSDWKTYAGYRSVTDLIESHQYIFFATDGSGLLRYDKFRREFIAPITSSNGLRSNTIYEIKESIDDTNSVTKNSALLVTDRGNQIIDLSIKDDFLFPYPIQSGFRAAPTKTHLKKVDLSQFTANFWPPFIMNASGVSDDKFEYYKNVYSYKDLDQNYWLIVKNLGLFKANTDASPYRFHQVGPKQSPINSIALHQGDIWLGQDQINAKNPIVSVWRENNLWENWNNEDLHHFEIQKINKVVSDSQFLWLGTNNGLIKLSTETINASRYLINNQRHQKINDIEILNNRLLLATDAGLISYSRETDSGFEIQFKGLSNSPAFSVAVGDSLIIVVNRFGIYKLNSDYSGISLLNDELSFEPIRTRLVDFYNGKFWFNSDDGIFSYDPKSGKSVEIKLFSPNFRLRINKLIVSGDYIFLATNKGLIIYYANLDDWIWFSTGDGLANNNVRDLILDGDYLFIATQHAITEFRWFDKRRTY